MRPMNQEEKEIEMLLNEIPHLSRNNHHYDVNNHPFSPFSVSKNYACFSPSSFFSDGSSGSGSGSLSGTPSPRTDDFKPDLDFGLLHRLQCLNMSNFNLNYRDNHFRLPPNLANASLNYGYNPPFDHSVNDAFAQPNYSNYNVLPDQRLLGSGGNLRDFEGLLYNNGVSNSISRISEALIQSQMPNFQNYNRSLNLNLNLNAVNIKTRHEIEPIEAFKCEESLIIQGNPLNQAHYKTTNTPTTKSRKNRGNAANSQNAPKLPLNSSLNYENLMGVKGYLLLMAKDQHGCRFLQSKFEEGKTQVDLVYEGIVDHALELMVNQFGNYLMQKLLEVCDEDQRLRLVLILTQDPAKLVKVSLNVHGTRVVQKLIETLGNKRQVNLIICALKPGFLDLMKDLNGNHVVQQCLQSLKPEDNKFIFEAAAKHCVDIATHQHGCCVLQRCIACSSFENRAKLVAQVSSNGFLLAQDAFGNYVVQFVLDLKIPSANSTFASQFEGKYVELSKQKFSSNVVEKCLKIFSENDKAKIVLELLSASRFDQLVQDPYANYVIHTALQTSKGSLHSALVEAIKPHAEVLRTNPHCKRIVSRSLLKKN